MARARALGLLAVAAAAHACTPARKSIFTPTRLAVRFAGFARRSTPDEAAACYAARYPDLRAAFCDGDRCNARQARAHFRNFGKREGRKFGCDKGLKPKVLPG